MLPQVKDDLYRGLSKEGYFDGNPETVRGASFVLGILLVLAVLAVTCMIQYGLIGRVFYVPVIIAGVLSVLAVVITSRFMPRKTRKGRITWEKIAGLQEYIRRAEVDNLQENERQGVFERLLPYAIIFGLSKRWGKAFADLYRQPPDWYQPARPMGFSTWMLVNDLDRSIWMMATAGQAAGSAAADPAAAGSAAAGEARGEDHHVTPPGLLVSFSRSGRSP